jgi:hypothetical protein
LRCRLLLWLLIIFLNCFHWYFSNPLTEFERKGIDEKYYKDLGEEGKVKNDAVFHEYKLKKQKEFLSEFRALASTDVMKLKSMIALSPSFMAFNNISKLLSLVFFKSFNLSPSQSLGTALKLFQKKQSRLTLTS